MSVDSAPDKRVYDTMVALSKGIDEGDAAAREAIDGILALFDKALESANPRATFVKALALAGAYVGWSPPGAPCTGVTASWCPVCGDCTCGEAGFFEQERDPSCPLHADESRHAEGTT